MTAFRLDWPLTEVVRWFTYSPKHRVELTSHAVLVQGGWWIFDPIPLAPASVESWLNRHPVHGILLTNTNHLRTSGPWQRRCGCPVFVPSGTNWALDAAVELPPRKSTLPGLEIIPLAGGAPGETAFRIASLSLVVFGDAVVNLPGRTLEILPDRYATDPPQLRQRLTALLRTPFQRALFAHGHPLLKSAQPRINALL